MINICFYAISVVMALLYSQVFAAETVVLTGQITDVEGQAVPDARVFAYDDAQVKRPANFMSAPADNQGRFQMVLMPGKYWFVARLKKGEEYGPLMPGDKHSGEPVVLSLEQGQDAEMSFTVADLKDARKIRTKEQKRPVRVSGRIVDEKGSPVTKAYAIAHRKRTVDGIPDHVSAWVDSEGRYSLYLPAGEYVIGGATKFPPGQAYFIQGNIAVDNDTSGIDIIMKSQADK